MNSFYHQYSKLRLVINHSIILVAFFVCGLFAPPITNAEPLMLTINPATLTSTSGATVIFRGSITNNTGVGLNATDLFLNFSNFNQTFVTPTQILGNPDFFFANGATVVTDLFSVTLAPSAVVGSIYSIDVFLQDVNTNFSNSVTANITAVPEPATMLLLGTGLASAVALRKRRHQTRG